MVLEDLEKKIEEYRKFMKEKFGSISALKNAYKPIVKHSEIITGNLLDDFLENYNVGYFNYYDKVVFLFPEERPNIEGSIVFAENVDSNFCYVYNLEYEGRIFCVTLDTGDYLWEVAKSYESFFRLLIEFINLDMHYITNGDLADDEYRAYFNRCMSIVGGDEDLEQYIKFMCCIVD